jgi:hypothetical protein
MFWLPFLFGDASDNCGYDYSFVACIFLALGTVLPLGSIIVICKFKLALAWEVFYLGTPLLTIFSALLVYLLVGLVAHFSIKSVWGSGLL